MPASISSAFDSFHNYLIPYNYERDAARQHRTSVVNKLTDSFGVDYDYEIGSLGNGTGIHNYVDLDLMVSIPSYNQRDNSYHMLTDIKTALEKRFPSSTISVRTPAVRATFGSDGSEVVEIVPGYYQKQVDGSNVYKIPDFGGEFQLSVPRAHTNYVTSLNTQLNGKVKPLIRFIKAIKYYHNIPLSSFYLEMRVAKWASSETSIIYSYDVTSVLRHLITSNLASLQDPTGNVGYISGYTTSAKHDEAISKLQTALSRAEKALQAEHDGNLQDAHFWWNMVFDGKFSS